MKDLYIIGGTMGVGKTTTCRVLKQRLDRCVFLDGDWCWDMHPFQVTTETKHMVMENICFLLNNFLQCSIYENIVFCWVLHEQAILDDLLSRLDIAGCRVHLISLTCAEPALRARLRRDVAAGIRAESCISRSAERLPLYQRLNTQKVDVSEITPAQAAAYILQNC
ncbi:MAG TPA: AAA family ATPase [Candidatus Limiplasma sp.]|nr:AAA family ATPase [Candidatus Limiplasma sp.]